MSSGDNLIGIKTVYKGIEMRSKLETKVAMFLDGLKVLWIYEPKLFMLSNGIMYKPDFYLPDHKIWIEVKGLIEEHNEDISKIFVEDNKTTLIMISPEEVIWHSLWIADNSNEYYKDKTVQLGKCPKCKRYFFTSCCGDWSCTCCGYYDGDHIILGSINGEAWEDNKINFSDIESIREGLKYYDTTN